MIASRISAVLLAFAIAPPPETNETSPPSHEAPPRPSEEEEPESEEVPAPIPETNEPERPKPRPRPSPSPDPSPDPSPSPGPSPGPSPSPSSTSSPSASPGLVAPAPAPAPAAAGGYWLSAELIGPAAARGRALELLRASTGVEGPREPDTSNSIGTLAEPSPIVGLTGEAVAHVPDIQGALRWVEVNAFGEAPRDAAIDSPALRREPAAIPGAALRREVGVQLLALAVTGQTAVGERRAVDWPSDPAAILPPDSAWVPADLVPNAAPIFAAPGAAVPPASERVATIHRTGQLFLVRTIDRCDAVDRCLRWAQVVARDEDRFVPGYVPAFQVAVRRDWVRGQGELPRALIVRSGIDGPRARYLLLARGRDDALHRATVTAQMDGEGFPDADITIDGDWGTVIVGNEPPQRFALDATLDAREITPQPAGITPRPAGGAAHPPAADAPSPPPPAAQ